PRLAGSPAWYSVLINLVCVLILVAGLLATRSRLGTVAGFAVCSVVLALFLSRSSALTRPAVAGIGGAMLLAVAAGAILYAGGLIERVCSLALDADLRGQLYAQVLDTFASRPWLGYGGGTFEAAYPYFHYFPVSGDLVWDKAHSTYLSLWAELGLVVGSL